MNDFASRARAYRPPEGGVGVFWLGQAGFLLKAPDGRTIAIDPYFSDCVERLNPSEGLGFKRLTPPPCGAGDIPFDDLLITHEHNDHFDVDAIGEMMQNGRTQVYANAVAAAQMRKMGLDPARVHVLQKGAQVDLGGARLMAVDCDHGSLAPEAVGLLLDFGFVRVYYAGDTALTPARLAAPIAARPEVAILPINGAFGNLDGPQAAAYAGLLGCKALIPCHFWTFPLHHGDPQTLIDALPAAAPGCRLHLMRQGEGLLVGSGGACRAM